MASVNTRRGISVQNSIVVISATRGARRERAFVNELRDDAPVKSGLYAVERSEQLISYGTFGYHALGRDRRPAMPPRTPQFCEFDIRDRVAWNVWQEIANRQFRALLVEDLRAKRATALCRLPRWKRFFYQLFGMEPKVRPDAAPVAQPRGTSVPCELMLPENS
jgi:hypothetical protein